MILPIKFASLVLCILTKFRDFFETGNSAEKHMIYIYVIFDINNNLMFEACFVLKPCNFLNFIIGNIMNTDTRMLCMYKSILNLTLKQICDLCTINNQFK